MTPYELSASARGDRRHMKTPALRVLGAAILLMAPLLPALPGGSTPRPPGATHRCSAAPASTGSEAATSAAAVRDPLSDVRVAVLYDKVTDGALIGRTMDDVVQILRNIHAGLVFLGFERWLPVPESPEKIDPAILQLYRDVTGLSEEQVTAAIGQSGYSYEALHRALAEIENRLPNTLVIGGIHAQRVNLAEQDDETGEVDDPSATERLALDPGKFGLDISKDELQQQLQEYFSLESAYFPDITNPDFQKLLLSWAARQIDEGADGIWIDALFSQARAFERLTGDANDPAVRESYQAASRVVDEIHAYGETKYGRHIVVGTWWTFVDLPHSPPAVDFVTVSPSPAEIRARALDGNRWQAMLSRIRETCGQVPVLAFIDWGGSESQTAIFSQELSPDEQRALLRDMDGFFGSTGVLFAYPVHGGFMGANAARLAFGKLHYYDSLAPEFDTYRTLVKLAVAKLPAPRRPKGRVLPRGRTSSRTMSGGGGR